MKIQAITWKWVNLFLLLLVLLGYQYVQMSRAAAEDAAALQNQIDILTVEKEELQAEMASLQTSVVSDPADAAASLNAEGENAPYADGVYRGSGMGFGGDITVEVTVSDGALRDIAVLQAEYEDGEYLEMASKMIPDMIEAGSPEVDTVTGATLSSTGLRDAVRAALETGKQQ
ncbi:MAG: FMN-binding protein [Lachnospiraceae bacterium]|nr:FMN-binding protein [Lachnospiraceae bacterium]